MIYLSRLQSLEAEAQRAFAISDQDNDGKINQQELAFFLRALGTSSPF